MTQFMSHDACKCKIIKGFSAGTENNDPEKGRDPGRESEKPEIENKIEDFLSLQKGERIPDNLIRDHPDPRFQFHVSDKLQRHQSYINQYEILLNQLLRGPLWLLCVSLCLVFWLIRVTQRNTEENRACKGLCFFEPERYRNAEPDCRWGPIIFPGFPFGHLRDHPYRLLVENRVNAAENLNSLNRSVC